MLVLVLSAPTLIVATVVGLLIGLLQALTQIQDQTLSFAIKVAAVFIILIVFGSWTNDQIVVYTQEIFDNFGKLTK